MSTHISVAVQQQDVSIAEEYDQLRGQSADAGAVVFFSGCVRADTDSEPVEALLLEHYPGMTEMSLQDIAQQAVEQWQLQAVRVVHRVGRIARGEQIVFVGTAARHRRDAFAAAEFVMDYLKTRAPFWKKAVYASGERWVEAHEKDLSAAARWQISN